MGAIEDTRKVLQDFLAPEMREIKARLEALEKRFDGVDRKLDTFDRKLDDTDRRAEKRHDAVMHALTDYTDGRARLARREATHVVHQ